MVRSLRSLAPRAVYVFAGWPMKNKEVRSYKASVQRDLFLAAKVPDRPRASAASCAIDSCAATESPVSKRDKTELARYLFLSQPPN